MLAWSRCGVDVHGVTWCRDGGGLENHSRANLIRWIRAGILFLSADRRSSCPLLTARGGLRPGPLSYWMSPLIMGWAWSNMAQCLWAVSALRTRSSLTYPRSIRTLTGWCELRPIECQESCFFPLKWNLSSDAGGDVAENKGQNGVGILQRSASSCAAVWFFSIWRSLRIGSGWCFMVDICFMLVAYAVGMSAVAGRNLMCLSSVCWHYSSLEIWLMTLCNFFYVLF